MRMRWSRTILTATALAVAFSIGVSAGKGDWVRRLNLPERTDDRPFSHLVVAGETIYVAGSIGLDAETGKIPEDPMDEARLMLDSVKRKLALADATMDDLVSVQVFCSDVSLYEEFNKVYASYFKKGAPARAFVGSGALLFGARFEINGIAVKR
jgi:2-iminobutanoate/2-iminopropanoate deaminase